MIGRVQAESAQNFSGKLAAPVILANCSAQAGHSNPVTAAVVAEQVTPAAGPRGFTGGVAADDDGAGTADDEDAGFASESGGVTGIEITADEKTLGFGPCALGET